MKIVKYATKRRLSHVDCIGDGVLFWRMTIRSTKRAQAIW